MNRFICVTCGTQFLESEAPPQRCPICTDVRQYVNWKGQQWTTLEQLRAGHRNVLREEEPGLIGVGTKPEFAIGQRALLVRSAGGNVLWDCISLIDDATVEEVRKLGGISAIAISHPHFFSAMVEWSHAFGHTPILLHTAHRPWVMRPDPAIDFWGGETHQLSPGLTLIRCGGHFPGSTVLHWAAGASGRGALFTGDTIYVVSDRRFVSFMFSYPNLIPLPARMVRAIVQAVEPFAYDRIYGGWFDRVVASDAKAVVARSAERYERALTSSL